MVRYVLLEGLEAGHSVVGTVLGIGWDTGLGIGVGLQGAELLVVLPVVLLALAAAVWCRLAVITTLNSFRFVASGTVGRHVDRGAGPFGSERIWNG